MSLVRGYMRGRSWVVAHWRRPHRDEPGQLPMPCNGDEPTAATPPSRRRGPEDLPRQATPPQP
ncbi:MAG: hypothetical protein H0W01_03500 [Pseudonocardiales bacterium]|nr:hypothetical protein [Pseudonocardiales bacterium]